MFPGFWHGSGCIPDKLHGREYHIWPIPRLFCNPQKTELEEVNTLIRRIQGKLVAQSYMMIEYDCPAELLQKACEMTPGLDAPTVTKLHGREWYSVKAMVPQEEANAIMDRLWDVGARSILLFGIKSARI